MKKVSIIIIICLSLLEVICYASSVVLVEEAVFTEKELDGDYPTPEAIKRIMLTQYFREDQNIEVKKVPTGAQSVVIYAVSALVGVAKGNSLSEKKRKNIFFIKISKSKDAWLSLKKLQEEDIAKKLVKNRYDKEKKHIKNLPTITWLEKIFIYKISSSVYALEMTHAAQGESIFSIVFQNGIHDEIVNCGYRVGLTLAYFQQLFINYNNQPTNPRNWKVLCHGDFHVENVFFNKKNSRVSYIDNGTMRTNCSVLVDLTLLADIIEKINDSELDKQEDYRERSNVFLENFAIGYLDGYKNINIKSAIAKFLKEQYRMMEFPVRFFDDYLQKNASSSVLENVKKKNATSIQRWWRDKDSKETLKLSAEFMNFVSDNYNEILKYFIQNKVTIVTIDLVEQMLATSKLFANQKLMIDEKLYLAGFAQAFLL